MLLTKRKRARPGLLRAQKARTAQARAEADDAARDHDRQLAVVDSVEWAAERWSEPELGRVPTAEPRALQTAQLIAALVYLDPRFSRLDPEFVAEIIDRVTDAPSLAGPRLDAKAAAALLTVEVGAFRR
jgi:hypothetical protein